MKKIFLSALFSSLMTTAAFAETAVLKVDGMHCGGCKKMVEKSLCKNEKISAQLSSCEVTVDTKIQVGTVTVKSKDNAPLDMDGIQKAIQSASDDYKISIEKTAK